MDTFKFEALESKQIFYVLFSWQSQQFRFNFWLSLSLQNQKLLEERNVSLMESVSQLKEELRETTCQQAAKDREAREQQKGLMELQNKLSIAETMLQTEKAVSLDLLTIIITFILT